jgi:tRNA wybutosine-synthesizing protein 1
MIIMSNTIEPSLKTILEKQQYRLAGKHSAVKLCTWLKKSMRDLGVCYKEKFYGIKSHRCLQMTPSISWCPNRCLYCWRSIEETSDNDMDPKDIDDPKTILDSAIEQQRSLIVGFKGFDGTNIEKFKEAQNPNQIAISLSGEPTSYPKINELVEEAKSRGMTTFVVTNGQFPNRLKDLDPYQLYLSIDAPTKEIYKKLDQPKYKDFWDRFIESAKIMGQKSCKKAVRLTIVQGFNDNHIKEYIDLIELTKADYIEVKAYMHVGFSQNRLPKSAMPTHIYIQEFAKQLENNSKNKYKITKESPESRVVLLERIK